MYANKPVVVDFLDKYELECYDEDVLICLDEGVLACLDNDNRDNYIYIYISLCITLGIYS